MTKLLWRMILATMAGKKRRTWNLYEQYKEETRLHVPVEEYMKWRKRHEKSA